MIEKVGKFQIESRLGKGGMGVVYKAWDTVLERYVALKTIRPEFSADPDVKARLLREAQAVAQLRHPNIVTIFDLGEEAGRLFIAMEYVQGTTLTEAQSSLSLERILEVMDQVCAALQYAHEAGIVHRDVKPSNVLLTEDGSVRLLDFGIAHLEGSTLTRTGMTMGTPDYMSPELVEGGTIDARSDIFSCGVLFYELLTANRPFQHERITTIIYKIVHEDAPPLSQLAAGVPVELENIVARMLAKDPDQRYQSLKEVAEDLQAYRQSPTLATDALTIQAGRLFGALRRKLEKAKSADEDALPLQFGSHVKEAGQRLQTPDQGNRTEWLRGEIARLEALRGEIEGSPSQRSKVAVSEPSEIEDEEVTVAPQSLSAPLPAGAKTSPLPSPVAPDDGETLVRTESQSTPVSPRGGRAAWIAAALAAAATFAIGGVILWPRAEEPIEAPLPQVVVDEATAAEDVVKNPSPIDWSRRLEKAYRAQNPRDVLRAVTRLERTGKASSRSHLLKGWALARTDRLSPAVVALNRALKSTRQRPEAMFFLGDVLLRQGDRPGALRHYLGALSTGGLTPDRRKETVAAVETLDLTFPALHLHDDKGNNSCRGTFEVHRAMLRFLGEKRSHSRTLSRSILKGIQIDDSRITLARDSGSEFLYQLERPEDMVLVRTLLIEVFGWSLAEAGGEGDLRP